MRKVFDFLRDLQENNAKEWMHANKDYYQDAKDTWVNQLDEIYKRLAKHDDRYDKIDPSKTIMRINNNLMYQPDKPTYKDYFASSPFGKKASDLYIHVSPNGSFIAGGVYRVDNKTLKKIRAAIDYDGDKLKNIIQADPFQKFFGGLEEDEEKLKTSPKGYSDDHPHIELLRRKNFIAVRNVTQKEVLTSGFTDLVEEGYLVLRPFIDYMRKAIEFQK